MSEPWFLRGIEEFNRGHFFAAHELWEELWNETVGEEKRFYQALVQIAAGYLKLSLAQYHGAYKLLDRGRQTLTGFSSDYGGVDLAPLLAALAATMHDLSTGQTRADFLPPQIRVLTRSS